MTPVEEKTENVSAGDKSAADLKIESVDDVKDKMETAASTDDKTAAEKESVVELSAKDGVAPNPRSRIRRTVHMTITRYASTIRFGRSGRCGDMITRL